MKDDNRKIKESLGFNDLTPEEKEKRGILGRLYGPIADVINPTRNGRAYSNELWKKVFEGDIVKELLAKGGIPGELGHPSEREEVEPEKIAIMMPEAPKEDDQGHLIGYFDILDTPCGKIAYQLAKYGFQLGISSRGTGDLITDDDGNEAVDPDTYDFTCFDLVIVPAVESARLTMQEGLSKEKNEFKVALTESLNSASESDRKIMEEALNELNITVGDNVNIDSTPNSKTSKKLNEANNDGSLEMIRSL